MKKNELGIMTLKNNHSLPFKKINAFATKTSTGNPAGYISLKSLTDIPEHTMLNIAKELKAYVNEVGFVAQKGDKVFDFKYFSSEREVDFCGHATIAIMYDLVKTNKDLSKFNTLEINTNRGRLKVENNVETEDAVFIMSPEPIYIENKLKNADIVQKLRIDFSSIDNDYPVSIINAGLTTLLVPITDLGSILGIHPYLDELKDFCLQSGIDIIEVFTPDVFNKKNNFRTRVFAPTFGYLEDPATGSGNSALGYYLTKHGLWGQPIVHIEQNGSKENFNSIKLKKIVDGSGKTRVSFGGGGIVIIEGVYNTPFC